MCRFFAVLGLIFITTLKMWSIEPIQWSADVKMHSNDEGSILINAAIESGWKLYGMEQQQGGPISTTFDISITGGEILSDVTPIEQCIESFDEMFQLQLSSWIDKVNFIVPFKAYNKDAFIRIKIKYMACNGTICNRPIVKELFVKINNNEK